MPDALPFRPVVRFAVGNRTLVYGSLAATLALAYFGGVAAPKLSFARSPAKKISPNSPHVKPLRAIGEPLARALYRLKTAAARRPEPLYCPRRYDVVGYWAFDALCLILMFAALGVAADPLVLLVAYGVATAIAAIPLTPGGIGVFETTMLATLALLGVGSEAAIPILGYRLFNFWLPIPLAAVFYPTLRRAGRDRDSGD